MPIYIYENDKGERIEELRLYRDRERCPNGYSRVLEPSMISIPSSASSPVDMKKGILNGYYKEECRAGSRWPSEFSKKKIKKAWSE